MFEFIRNRINNRHQGAVTICIPAWQAEGFIDRTIRCARNQTYTNVRIKISIDHSMDGTEQICRTHAREDRRVETFVHRERLGWANNVNFLLDRVSTEFFFLYFHDDLIDPTYTMRLLKPFHRRPDAASVHCDMGHFGGSDHVSIGKNYDGSDAERLIKFFFLSEKGSPLRSIIRTDVLSTGLRLPTAVEDGFWANQPFLMRLLAAGPALRVPKVLYKRWDKREGGLTDGWNRFTFDQVIAGFQTNTRICFDILDRIPATTAETNLMTFGLYIYIMAQVRRAETHYGSATRINAENLSSRFRDIHIPNDLKRLKPDFQRWAVQSYERVHQSS